MDRFNLPAAQAAIDRQGRAADAYARRLKGVRDAFVAALETQPTGMVEAPCTRDEATVDAALEFFDQLSDASKANIVQILLTAAAEGDTVAQTVIETTALSYADCVAEAEI